ncbi:L,D-transpeptidase [Pararhodobacter sp. SW119]|uniref:L,D-transpeptidase n=1 Tax=Pararhodobacter sp. SW119 TaxID=2780075 RepID=UPI001FD7EF27|nr:L,D-transpeptidase [Pararhodobacter sp. SW119]
MTFFRRAAFAVLASVCLPAAAQADRIVARVSIASQTMHVYEDGQLIHEWPVSTARRGKITPTGEWTAQWLSRNHRSRRYDNAPMPFAIFYDGHYAIHGTDQVGRLGRPASAGCVRLHPENARVLFDMVRAEGTDNMRIVVLN